MGGRPNKGTKKDRRLKRNRRRAVSKSQSRKLT